MQTLRSHTLEVKIMLGKSDKAVVYVSISNMHTVFSILAHACKQMGIFSSKAVKEASIRPPRTGGVLNYLETKQRASNKEDGLYEARDSSNQTVNSSYRFLYKGSETIADFKDRSLILTHMKANDPIAKCGLEILCSENGEDWLMLDQFLGGTYKPGEIFEVIQPPKAMRFYHFIFMESYTGRGEGNAELFGDVFNLEY